MGQATNQIEAHIDSKRAELGSNLEALEQRVRDATDWKRQYRQHPMPILGFAFGGGLLLASILGGRGNGHRGQHARAAQEGSGLPSKTLETWDNIKGALVNVAAAGFTDYVGKLVPGFRDHFERIQDTNKASPSGRP